jgi:hypothetical protein
MPSNNSWCQPYDDAANRIAIPHTGSPSRSWSVDGAFTAFEGRTYPVGARSGHVTDEVNVDTTWPSRADAEAFLAMLRDVALGADGRVEVHIGAMPDGQPIEMVAACHNIPENLAPGKTSVSVTFRRVDGVFTG